MSGHTSVISRADAPADFAATQKMPDWRAHVAWPVDYRQRMAFCVAVLDGLLDAVRGEGDEEASAVALLALGHISATVQPLGLMALALANEKPSGMRLAGDAPELPYLRGEGAGDAEIPARRRSAFTPPPKVSHLWLRRIARTQSWTPWYRLPGALLAPGMVAVTHNALLRDVASRSRVRFIHADVLLAEARTRHAKSSVDIDAIAGRLLGHLKPSFSAFGIDSDRLDRLVAAQVKILLRAAAADTAAVRAIGSLPRHLLSATGGQWPARALGIEVLRRGGGVTRCDHSGGIGLTTVPSRDVITEFAVSSRFIVPTPAIARAVETSGACDLLPDKHRFEAVGHDGDPQLRAASRIEASPATGKPRVLYAPIPLLGFRQVVPPFLPDTINLDWQMRLAKTLGALPVDFACRPHPEGLLRGKAHPLAAVTPLSPRNFENLMADTDVFVFDYVQSTTFYEALCTDRVIVLIDMGLPVYRGWVREKIERRCRIVPARFDERNRPHVDQEALRDAIMARAPRPDPAPFHHLFVGER